jgi:catechol 2,3-dioxygenase-like lactoylglutathione lyase family enzyme
VSNDWSVTFDAHHAPTLAAFWAIALGYVPAPPPKGFLSWQQWYEKFELTGKNRVHLDVQIGGGRAVDPAVRWPRIEAMVARLKAAGGTVAGVDTGPDGAPDHVVMLDPEGNEFCVV